jgi:glycosyltransferase involved in cell wall biosynthesis
VKTCYGLRRHPRRKTPVTQVSAEHGEIVHLTNWLDRPSGVIVRNYWAATGRIRRSSLLGMHPVWHPRPVDRRSIKYVDIPKGCGPALVRAWLVGRSAGGQLDTMLASSAGPHVLHAHGVHPPGSALAGMRSRSGVKHIVTVHSAHLPPRSTSMWRWWRSVLRESDGVTAVAAEGAARLIDEFGLERCRAVPNPVNDAYLSAPLAERVSDRIRVLFVGNLVPEKRPSFAIEVVERLSGRADGRRVSLTVVGDGVLRREVEMRAAESTADITVAGAVPNDALVGEYGKHDVLLSTSAWESFGLVLAEALALGLPVVASRTTGAVAQLTDPVLGSIVDADADADAYADCIAAVAMSDSMERAAVRRAHVTSVCSSDVVGRALVSVYDAD